MVGRVVAVLLAVSLFAVVPAQAQVKSCGEGFELFIRNPDVNPSEDGKFHVSGDLFVQFQVIGPEANQIEAFAFSVGLPVDNPEEICDLAYWPAGLMLEAYKVDLDKEDGFFIYMNTDGQTTPQGIDLSVAVHGYDADGNELARFWGTAVVDSCPGPGPGGCDSATAIAHDVTMPWMVVLPGDGSKTYVEGFSIEFAEPLSELHVFLNGEEVTDDLAPWEGRLWDADTYYDYGPAGVFATATPMCTLPAPIQSCVKSPGPAYQWNGRAITDDDVIRVEAFDASGNRAQKELHVGSSVAGGAIADDVPILTLTFDETQALSAPGGTAVFRARVENTGGGTGHPFVGAEIPGNWSYEWTPGHKPVPGASEVTQELNVEIPADTPAGIYPFVATMDYRQGNEDRTLRSSLEVLVGDGAVGNHTAEAAAEAGVEAGKDSPGLGWLVGPVLLAFALRRR